MGHYQRSLVLADHPAQGHGEPALQSRLDRIRFDRTHIVGSIDPVNPVYTYEVEQIHGR